ncbi:hypothetical protein SO802_023426 [Lithocarpus litseifolius]|uniref:Putative plant transposon protein domain-containing protein n=1 Tax=Lithocarpus litseifolius TaxID=425828 RepID=A0AAW2C8C9_9ROSI
MVEFPTSPISKRTRQASANFDRKKFRTITNFKLSLLTSKCSSYGGKEYPIEDLIKEFFANAWFIEDELKCWVRKKNFFITPDYLAPTLQIDRLEDADTTPYDDRFRPLDPILALLGTDCIVSSMETSVGTRMFTLEVKILTLIMYSNLYPLINTVSINIGRARFLYDLITTAPIDICAHIFQTLGKTAGRSARRTCLPFCNLIMKILLL